MATELNSVVCNSKCSHEESGRKSGRERAREGEREGGRLDNTLFKHYPQNFYCIV